MMSIKFYINFISQNRHGMPSITGDSFHKCQINDGYQSIVGHLTHTNTHTTFTTHYTQPILLPACFTEVGGNRRTQKPTWESPQRVTQTQIKPKTWELSGRSTTMSSHPVYLIQLLCSVVQTNRSHCKACDFAKFMLSHHVTQKHEVCNMMLISKVLFLGQRVTIQ